jgi:hypothetical protein
VNYFGQFLVAVQGKIAQNLALLDKAMTDQWLLSGGAKTPGRVRLEGQGRYPIKNL